MDQAFRRHRPPLLRLLRRSNSPDEADDVVQQVFLRLAERRPGTTVPVASPGAYLRRIASNLVADRVKAAHRRPPCVVADEELVQVPDADPVTGLEARDMLRRIEAIVARMPERRREIFLAHRIDGYSYAEIAARTGISVKGVEKQMSRAIAQIDRMLARR